MEDIEIENLRKKILGEGIVDMGNENGLNKIGRYKIGMVIKKEEGNNIKVVEDKMRNVFEKYRRKGRFEKLR